MSVARYLAEFKKGGKGWSDRWQDQHGALFRYNRDEVYRDWVLEYREKLIRTYFTYLHKAARDNQKPD